MRLTRVEEAGKGESVDVMTEEELMMMIYLEAMLRGHLYTDAAARLAEIVRIELDRRAKLMLPVPGFADRPAAAS